MGDPPVRLIETFLPPTEVRAAFDELLTSLSWRDESIVLFGRPVLQPRRVAFHSDAGVSYAYSGRTWAGEPWTPLLSLLRSRAQEASNATFNSVLCNLYRNGSDSMGWHSDNERSLGPSPLIASVSLGAPRTFRMRRKEDHGATASYVLPSGSLFVMQGDCQRAWHHCVPKTKRVVDPRINLTFRWVRHPERPC